MDNSKPNNSSNNSNSNVGNDNNDKNINNSGESSSPEAKKKEYKFGTNSDANVNMLDFNFDGIELTKNPTMSYYEAKTQYASPEDGKNMAKKMSGIPDGMNKLPPSFHNRVVYPHRQYIYTQANGGINNRSIAQYARTPFSNSNSDDSGYFRLGTSIFKVPPEFITVSNTSGYTAVQNIRSKSSLKTNQSYANKEIMVNLILNGIDQINGYKVDSAFDYPWYVDGLRELLGQFMYTPFVPVENVFLNVQHNIHVVALKNITVETVTDFPNTLNIRLTLVEANITPYTQAPNCTFDESINWDLFNFYIQRNIRDKDIGLPLINNNHLSHRVKLSILKAGLFDGDAKEINLLDSKNYELAFDTDTNNAKTTSITFATGNKLPKIQLSYYETPTFQYLGSTDTEFVIQFETTDQNTVSELTSLNSNNLTLVRENKDKNNVGFIKIENDLINLTGTSHIAIGNITSSTVPGFPGLYTITISGVSCDAGQKDREKFKKFRPFYDKNNKKEDDWLTGRDGDENDLITQSKRGLANKVIQDAAIEAKLMATEMYPDLRLPKYSAVDWALGKFRSWRSKNNLEPLPFTRMPRPKGYIPGRGAKEVEYNSFVDPDFYVMYPFQAGEMDPISNDLNTIKKNNTSNVKNKKANIIDDNSLAFNYKKISKDIFGTEEGNYNKAVKSESKVKSTVLDKLLDGSLNPMSTLLLPQPCIETIVEPKYVPGYEPDQQLRLHKGNLEKTSDQELIDKLNSWVKVSVTGGVGSGSGVNLGSGEPSDPTQNPKSVSRVTGNPFVDLLINRAQSGCGYVFGASQKGDICTQAYINAKRRAFPGIGGWEHTSKWIGKQVWDCSSFVCWGLIQIGLKPSSFKITSGMWGPQGKSVSVNPNTMQVGDLMYGGGHIAVYIGDNKVVHASSHKKGCVIGSASAWNGSSKCRLGCRVRGLEDACKKFLQNNPNFYTGSGSSSASSKTTNSTNTASTKAPESNSASGYSSGLPVLGKFGSSPMSVTTVSGKTYKFNGTNADKWDDLIIKHSKTHNLDPNFIKTILMIESGGNPKTISPANCYGLMQVHQTYFPIRPNPLDPDANIKMGCKVLKNYGGYKKPQVNYDKTKWITCYNAGPGTLQKILNGQRSTPTETKNYMKKYDVFYARLVQSGGKPGATITPTVGGMVNPPSSAGSGWGEGSGEVSPIDVKVWFELPNSTVSKLTEKDLSNPNEGKRHSALKSLINTTVFGVLGNGAVLVKNSIAKNTPTNSSTSKNTRSQALLRNKSTNLGIESKNLLKAPQEDSLPTQAEFGIGEIDSLSDGELDFDRGKISNIDDFKNQDHVVEKMFIDSATYGYKGRLSRAFPSYLFLIIDEHQGWIDSKRFWSNYYLYQSVVEMQVHEPYDSPISTARVVLTNMNRNLRKYKKSSLTENIMNDRDIGVINKAFYRFFGSMINEKVTDDMIKMRNELYDEIYMREGLRIHIRMGYGSNPAKYSPTFSGVITEVMDNGEMVTIAAQGDGAELVSTSVTDRTNATNKDIKLPEEPSDIIAALLCNRENEFLYTISGGKWKLENTYGISHFGEYSSGDTEGLFTDGGLIRRDRLEYDIVKNIYRGSYKPKYMYEPTFFGFDGEVNMRFFCYNRTPWDLMKMCEKMNPEFVCYPRPFGLENRIFFGLPWWQCKSRYERDDSKNTVYEFSKAFSQINPINSFSDIIDNRIKIDTSELATNMIGIYSLGGDLASTPVIMSDVWIDKDKQVTKTIDTTSTQNFKGLPNIIDKALEWTGAFDNGKHNAIRVCLSELIDSWKNTYSGELITLGAPEIRCHNYMYLSDLYANISGTCHVREVVHSLSGDTGFITTSIPGLISVSALKNSGAPNIIKSINHVGSTLFAYTLGSAIQSIAIDKIGSVIAGSKFATALSKYGPKALSFLKTKGSNIVMWAKRGEIISKLGAIISLARSTIQASAVGSSIVGTVSSIVAGLGITAVGAATAAMTALAIVGTFIIGSLITNLITSITDMFKYENSINVYPMFIEDRPLLGGATGQKDLFPNTSQGEE